MSSFVFKKHQLDVVGGQEAPRCWLTGTHILAGGPLEVMDFIHSLVFLYTRRSELEGCEQTPFEKYLSIVGRTTN